jgi:hypothetical protein
MTIRASSQSGRHNDCLNFGEWKQDPVDYCRVTLCFLTISFDRNRDISLMIVDSITGSKDAGFRFSARPDGSVRSCPTLRDPAVRNDELAQGIDLGNPTRSRLHISS